MMRPDGCSLALCHDIVETNLDNHTIVHPKGDCQKFLLQEGHSTLKNCVRGTQNFQPMRLQEIVLICKCYPT